MNKISKLLLTLLVSFLIAMLSVYCMNENLEGLAFIKKSFMSFIFISLAQSVNHWILTGKLTRL